MAGGLAQAEQGFKHLDLGLRQTFCIDALQQEIPIVLAQLVVELALFRFHLAVNGLLAFGRQLARNLLLGAAQNEWLESMGKEPAGFPIRITRCFSRQFEYAGCTQHAGIQKLEKRPKLAKMVLYGRATERQT